MNIQLEPKHYIMLAFGAFMILTGLASIFTHKLYLAGGSYAEKYTEESLTKYSLPQGIMNFVVGIGLVCCQLLQDKVKVFGLELGVGYIILIVCAIIMLCIWFPTRKMLVKKSK